MNKTLTTSRELNRVITSFTIFKFVKDIITPFKNMKLYKQKKIDEDGNYLVDNKTIPPYYRLIINLKKLLAQIPKPKTKAQLKYLTTALVLFTEETKQHGADPDEVFNGIADFLLENGLNIDESLESLLNEDAMIANSVGAGGVYGARGNTDETIINQIAHLKRMKLMRRRRKPLFINIT